MQWGIMARVGNTNWGKGFIVDQRVNSVENVVFWCDDLSLKNTDTYLFIIHIWLLSVEYGALKNRHKASLTLLTNRETISTWLLIEQEIHLVDSLFPICHLVELVYSQTTDGDETIHFI